MDLNENMDLNETTDLKETKIREEIEFWKDFIDKWRAFRTEPVHKMAVESLAQAEKKLQCYFLAKDMQRAGKGHANARDQYI